MTYRWICAAGNGPTWSDSASANVENGPATRVVYRACVAAPMANKSPAAVGTIQRLSGMCEQGDNYTLLKVIKIGSGLWRTARTANDSSAAVRMGWRRYGMRGRATNCSPWVETRAGSSLYRSAQTASEFSRPVETRL